MTKHLSICAQAYIENYTKSMLDRFHQLYEDLALGEKTGMFAVQTPLPDAKFLSLKKAAGFQWGELSSIPGNGGRRRKWKLKRGYNAPVFFLLFHCSCRSCAKRRRQVAAKGPKGENPCCNGGHVCAAACAAACVIEAGQGTEALAQAGCPPLAETEAGPGPPAR